MLSHCTVLHTYWYMVTWKSHECEVMWIWTTSTRGIANFGGQHLINPVHAIMTRASTSRLLCLVSMGKIRERCKEKGKDKFPGQQQLAPLIMNLHSWKKYIRLPGKCRVALHSIQPTARPDDEASQRFQLHYKPGMDLTTISSPFPTVDDDSSDSEISFEDEEHSEDYSLIVMSVTSPIIICLRIHNLSLISTIQEAMLELVLEGQKRLVERQDGFEHQLTEPASKVKQPLPSTLTQWREKKAFGDSYLICKSLCEVLLQ